MMTAVRIHRFGGPEVLERDAVPIPQPEDDEVLVRIHAASVNPVDYKTRSGSYPAVREGDLPKILGRDLSGTVESCGTRAHTLRKGDAVFALLGRERGAYAEYAVVKAVEMAAKPASLDHVQAAAVPLAALTAWQGLFEHGGLGPGQRVLIHGGAGGVGHFAVQFAKTRGAHVATTVSAGDLDFARALGADQVIDYKGQRFEDEVRDLDMVLDLVSGETRERSWAVLRKGGILVSSLGQPDEAKAAAHGVRASGYVAQPDAAALAEIGRLIDDGAVRVTVARTFPFERVGAAQDALEHGHLRGKVVLTMAP
ncbi:NADP-dependent oxidoreductase [Arenibaculum pallidiluteum]|uniref:NADP-dependent oxidoreductase n=1 Tax=Arenibaculum pallidiluteum TaxID=2812559 RepID=UPI001A97B37B|nr:NADP-dependent oxidoreductase [Arenibaculum pallidiluteum]